MKSCSQNFSFPILKSITVIGIITFALLCSCLQVLAQWGENFSDGDFTTDLVWAGDTERFTAVNNVLQLNAPAVSGTAELTTSSNLLSNCSWTFSVAMNFNPSGSNYARVYLGADSPDLSSALNGYYVMVGGVDDDVSLYRQDGSTRTRIVDGPDGELNSSSVNIRVKVTHDDDTGWTLLCDKGSGTFVELGSSGDVPFFTPAYFGIQCTYTATRSAGFFFDDFETQIQSVQDIVPPSVNHIVVVDSSLVTITFSEAVEEISSLKKSNYSLTSFSQFPTSVVSGADLKTVSLSFSPALTNGFENIISISGINDRAGNQMEPFTGSVMYFRALPYQRKDIVFSEILADESPSQSLPEAEFVEIINRSANPIQLLDWIITDGSSRARLPAHVLASGGYLILTHASAKNEFSGEGTTIGLNEFPSLNNSGDLLKLVDHQGTTIDSILYSENWYHDSVKKSGGWTIEIIDPDNQCGDEDNWTASVDVRGGTPGKINSVDADNPDLAPPQIDNVVPISADTIRIFWSERLHRILPSTAAFHFSPLVEVRAIHFHGTSLRQTDLILASSLAPSTKYTVQVFGVQDCTGNILTESENFIFALPERAAPGDVVINEILFNPTSTGVDFVELLNASEKFIDLSSLSLAKPTESGYESKKAVATSSSLLSPGELIVATTEPETIESEYIRSAGKRMIKCELPSLPDDGGSIALLGTYDTLLDEVTYSPEMHSEFIEDFDGISLERISAKPILPLFENWTSAAKSAGYATPGERNSNSRRDLSPNADVRVSPESFAPREGQFTQIWYSFHKANLMANITIFDAQGRSVKTLSKGELLGSSGFVRWDGDSEDGSPIRTGAYMIVFEVFDSGGVVSTIRKQVAIGGKF